MKFRTRMSFRVLAVEVSFRKLLEILFIDRHLLHAASGDGSFLHEFFHPTVKTDVQLDCVS